MNEDIRKEYVASQSRITLLLDMLDYGEGGFTVGENKDMTLRINKLETVLRYKLQTLKEEKAMHGISVDPRISLEIEDIEAYFKDPYENL